MSIYQNRLFFAFVAAVTLGLLCSSKNGPEKPLFGENHVALELKVAKEFRFVAFGDTRFHDPADTEAANPGIRHALVAAIDKEKPAFVCIGGDIVYVGDNP